MAERSKLVRMRIENIGCIGPEGLDVDLDDILCIVGANNTGKSTVLRAYELALGTEQFVRERDLCQRSNGQPASVELWVHIPASTPNIAEQWKTSEEDLRLVRSRWEWGEETGWSRVRQTWDPEISDYSPEGKAAGLDEVFRSRLPAPFRIGTLQDPDAEHRQLLTLVLQPVADRLRQALSDQESDLNRVLAEFARLAEEPVAEEQARLDQLKGELNRSHGEIFPDLEIDFDVGLGDVQIDPVKQLLNNSHLKFLEWAREVEWAQQGTGSQRALFWAMLQVRSRLNALTAVSSRTSKEISDRKKLIAKLEKGIRDAKKEGTRASKRAEVEDLHAEIEELRGKDPEALLEQQAAELSLPGYMLLIDEPEVGLHPGAVRAASRYLYGLAEDPAWQVIVGTHSPLFIDPLQDHTTVVRLDRSQETPSPRTFRADAVGFTGDEKTSLKMLNSFDQALSEMFFGQYPVVIEGDTEFSAFEAVMNLDPSGFPVQARPVLVRARGKWTMPLIVKMLGHFRVPFSILHDTDSPYVRDGRANAAWTANTHIHAAVEDARAKGVKVIHRVSVPCFELAHLPVELDDAGLVKEPSARDKPWNMHQAILGMGAVKGSVEQLLQDLLDRDAEEEPVEGEFGEGMRGAVEAWAADNACRDRRFMFS